MPTASGTARRRLSFNGHTLQAASGMFHAAQKIVRRIGSSEALPRALRVFAWNVGGRLGAFEKRQIALNVIEQGRAWHWTKLPKGWFDLQFCLKHGQK